MTIISLNFVLEILKFEQVLKKRFFENNSGLDLVFLAILEYFINKWVPQRPQ